MNQVMRDRLLSILALARPLPAADMPPENSKKRSRHAAIILTRPLLIAGPLLAVPLLGLALAGMPSTARSQPDEGEGSRIYLPVLVRGISIPPPQPTWSTPPPTASATPHLTPTLTASPSPTPGATEEVTPTATITVMPGIPDCDRTMGDAGGFRFSLDGGATLAPGSRRLDNVAYTWAIDVDPRDPDTILELHQGALFRSTDAGCNFERLEGVPEGAWDQLVRAPSAPELWVLASVFESRLAWTGDDGDKWTVETLPDDVHALAIAPDDPWRWTFAGRQPALYSRGTAEEKFEVRPLSLEGVDSLISAAAAPAAFGHWIVGSSVAGLFRTEDDGLSWLPASDGLWGELGELGELPEPITALVPAWLGYAPSEPDIVYTVINRVTRNHSQRGIWRSEDGGRSWRLRVGPEDVARLSELTISGGTRVFVSPHDPEHVFFALGVSFGGFGTDLFRSTDGLASLELSHFDDFYGVYAMGFGPAGSEAVFVGASSNVPGGGSAFNSARP